MMTTIDAISAIGSNAITVASVPSDLVGGATQKATTGLNFGELLGQGLEHVEHKIAHADDMVRTFALDGSVPIHQVTIALEEARIAVELAMQVRTRLVEAYREIMNTQL
jgi:flagellar hook-basal body complex protein FliE